MTLNQIHSKRLERAIDLGAPFKLPAGALLKLDSDSPLFRHLFNPDSVPHLAMEVRPVIPEHLRGKEIPMRLIAGSSNKSEIAYLPFKIVRFGRQETRLQSSSRLPIQVSLKLRPLEQVAYINIRPLLPTANVLDLAPILEFLATLEESGEVEIFSLDPPGSLFRDVGSFSNRLNIPIQIRNVIQDAALVSRHFNKRLLVPRSISQEDIENVRTLKRIATGEQFSGIVITATVTKNAEHQENMLDFLNGAAGMFKMTQPTGWTKISVFGETFDCSSVSLVAEEVSVLDRNETVAEYLNASLGSGIKVRAECKSARFLETATDPT